MKLGKRIQRLRKAAGFESQASLAKAVGVSQPNVSDWERDDSQPTLANIKKLCEVLGVSSDELLGIKPNKKQRK